MDITYLLWLQGIRESLPDFVEQFFVIVSAIAASSALIVLPCLLYWCLDKRTGQFIVFTFAISSFVNNVIKCMVCCYRPWIRSADIHPSAEALPEATGYSFPSGHTQTAASLIGATGWTYRKRWPWLNIACWVFVALVAFSRNFLGVHTPQDVIVGLLEGIAVIAFVQRLMPWIDRVYGRDTQVLVFTLLAIAAGLGLSMLRAYPMDYDASGALLVDPARMQVDLYKTSGVLAGGVLGWYLERKLLSFETDPHAGWKRFALRLVIGFAVVAVLHIAPRPLVDMGLDERWYELIKNFLTILGAVFAGPAAFCAVERQLAKRSQKSPEKSAE